MAKIRCNRCGAFVGILAIACRTCELKESIGTGAGRKPKNLERRSMVKARHAVLLRFRAATSDAERARLSVLLASHDAKLAAFGPVRAVRRKHCPGCDQDIELAEAAWLRDNGGKKWHRICRQCQEKINPESVAEDVPAPLPVVETPMVASPVPKMGNKVEQAAAFDRKLAAEAIRPFILQYEALRTTPGYDRNEAERRLEIVLSRHGSPVVCDGWVYRWWREEQSISRMPAAGRQRPKPRMAADSLA